VADEVADKWYYRQRSKKMIRRIILFILLIAIITSGSVFATSLRKEHFIIRNYSSKTIIITVEYSDDPDKRIYPGKFPGWVQNVYGISLDIASVFFEGREYKVEPGRDTSPLEYYPWGNPDGKGAWAQLDQIPFMDKMRSIYKSIRVATEDGQKVITLENLGDQAIRKNVSTSGEVSYNLEIYD
jgi:hypothetical protein